MDSWDVKLESATIKEIDNGFEVHMSGYPAPVGSVKHLEHKHPTPYLEVYNLSVLPFIQNKNVAQMLLKSCERVASKRKIPALIEEGIAPTHPARGMYGRRPGWEKLDESRISEKAKRQKNYRSKYIFNANDVQRVMFTRRHVSDSLRRFDPKR